MSWDVSIMRFAVQYASVSDMPSDVQGLELGSRAVVHEAISEVFSSVDWSEPTWGQYSSSIGSIEFNNGGAEPLKSFMMHVRAGPEIVPLIVELCRRNGWSAIDCSTGEMLERSDEPEAGLSGWLSYRNQVIKDG